MDGFTIIDAVVAAVIILSAILAWSRGFVRESLAILGWIGAAVLAFIFAAAMRPLIAQLPVLDPDGQPPADEDRQHRRCRRDTRLKQIHRHHR